MTCWKNIITTLLGKQSNPHTGSVWLVLAIAACLCKRPVLHPTNCNHCNWLQLASTDDSALARALGTAPQLDTCVMFRRSRPAPGAAVEPVFPNQPLPYHTSGAPLHYTQCIMLQQTQHKWPQHNTCTDATKLLLSLIPELTLLAAEQRQAET